jgi:hypothetical protein
MHPKKREGETKGRLKTKERNQKMENKPRTPGKEEK